MLVRRASAVRVWALLLLMASLGSLPQGSLQDGSFATAAGVDDAATMSQRVLSAEQAPASSEGLLPALGTAVRVLGISQGSLPTPVAVAVIPKAPRQHFSAQPRAPPTI
jgi:hypothetical protein